MIRALLDGRKTQTRRLMPDQAWLAQAYNPIVFGRRIYNYAGDELVSEARFAPGDRLWVRESWRATEEWDRHAPRAIQPGYVRYEADPCVAHSYGKLRPSIFMPRWASRLTLLVTDVKVERLQDISDDDVRSEGCLRPATDLEEGVDGYWAGEPKEKRIFVRTRKEAFAALWNSLHSPGAWDANPWVCAVTFDVIRSNVDAIPTTIPVVRVGEER